MNKLDISKFQNVKWVAHRGIPSKTYENTITGFKIAAELPYWGIETDVHETHDDKYIIHHDDFVKFEDKQLFIDKLDSSFLRTIKFNNGDTLPFLSEYIEICKTSNKVAVVELKAPFTSLKIKKILAEIESLNYLDKTVIISFYFDNVYQTRSLNKDIPIQLLLGEWNKDVIDVASKLKIDINTHYSLLTKERVDELHNNGQLVNCWTVNEPDVALKLIEMGVDFITTDGF